jgi:transposase
MENLQESLGIPLPASTQWDIVADRAEHAEPVFDELVRQAAQGDVVYNDDTTIKILEVMRERARQAALAEAVPNDLTAGAVNEVAEKAATVSSVVPATDEDTAGSVKDVDADRTGTFTTGIVSTTEGRKIALFFSGRQHAGENLEDVLRKRAVERPPPIQMCDPLSRNVPKELKTILSNCLAHGRRQFTDVATAFPEECRRVLEDLAVVYKNDASARKQKLSPEERLRFHQAESQPTMDHLHAWLDQQIEDHLVEPNSGLGQAIRYLLRHWEKLTLFLRVPGAPLDNNICERALKKAILHRKNALFYKTLRGAHVGDIFMSLIYTCVLNGGNPFDYLTALERHAGEAAANPQDWMPWNYRESLEGMRPIQASSAESRPEDQ